MRRAILVATVLAATWSSPAFPQQSVGDIVRQSQQLRAKYLEEMSQGIVRVEAYFEATHNDPELGTGIVLSASPDRIWILTALHVIHPPRSIDARSVDVTFYSSRPARYHANVLPRRSDSLDLALLEVLPQGNPKLPATFPDYHFLQNGELQLGEQIYSVNGDWTLVPNTIARLSFGGDVNRFEYTNVSVGPGFSGGPVFDQYGNVVGMHDALTADEAHYAIAIKIDSALQTLQALDYAVPGAVPFSMPQFGPGGVPQSKASTAAPTQVSAASDTEAYMKAILLRDPDELEAAAAKLSNPTLAASLRTRAQMLRNASQAASSAAAGSDSRRQLQLQRTKTEAKLFANRGNYMKALPLYQQLAEGGDSESMVSLGYFYYNGWGVDQNYAQAAKWFEKAAAAGETSVMGALGLMYAMGKGVQQNDAIAVEWDRKAAAAGDATGMLGLGFLYEHGRGVPKNMAIAAEWYRKSANLGNETAKQNLRRLGLTQ